MIIFWITWALWFASEILLNRFMRSGALDNKKKDQGTLRFIWVMIGLAIASGILFSFFPAFQMSHTSLWPYAGLAIIVTGMILRSMAIRSLGKYFTVDVAIQKDHVLYQGGIYKFIRHPSYACSLLSFIGFGISLNNWVSLIIIITLMTISFIRRIKIEEQALMDKFGTDYLDYMKKTYRLIPWIY